MATSVVRSSLSRSLLQTAKFTPKTSLSASTLSTRNIALTSSIPPKRGMITQPLPAVTPVYEKEQPKTSIAEAHKEAMEAWNDEARAFTDRMNFDDIPEGGNHPQMVNLVTQNQIKSLYQELIDEDLFDPRLGWTASYDY